MPYKVTNIARGPRYFHHKAGTTTLDPNQSAENVEFGEGQLEGASNRGDFVIEDMDKPLKGKAGERVREVLDKTAGGDQGDEFDAMSDDELKAFIERRDGKATRATKRETLLSQARGGEGEE